MKILWFSNCELTVKDVKTSGTWLFTMANSLVKNGIELFNITQTSVKVISRQEGNGIVEYLIPNYSLINGLPSPDNIDKIINIVKEVTPDIIHIWGTEAYYGLLAARGYLKGNVLLEMQGLKATCSPVYYGGLAPKEIFRCIGLRELLRPSLSLPIKKRLFTIWGDYEEEMINGISNIATQSDWVRGWVSAHNASQSKTTIHYSLLSVRNAFCEADKWRKPQNQSPILLTMSASSEAYKGLHVAIRALALLKRQYPGIVLKVIGYYGENNAIYRKPGYTKYILRLMKQLGVSDNVQFVGQKDAKGIVEEMKKADCFLQTSFVESYSLALAEAMMIGIPSVVSYAGAMPELAKHEKDALFYSPLDYVNCASQINRLLSDPSLAESISKNSREIAMKRNTEKVALDRQLKIYNNLLDKNI